jgi:hypothetical protein
MLQLLEPIPVALLCSLRVLDKLYQGRCVSKLKGHIVENTIAAPPTLCKQGREETLFLATVSVDHNSWILLSLENRTHKISRKQKQCHLGGCDHCHKTLTLLITILSLLGLGVILSACSPQRSSEIKVRAKPLIGCFLV